MMFVVAEHMRHAILPKKYAAEYKLHCDWGTYGVLENLFTDGGKDFRSEHLKQIGFQQRSENAEEEACKAGLGNAIPPSLLFYCLHQTLATNNYGYGLR
jgi:hypothetical protein